jgi:hypothetical protein
VAKLSNIEQLDRLGQLPENWDTYGSPPIGKKAIGSAQRFIVGAWPVPTSGGGVTLEWHYKDGTDVEISWDKDGKLSEVYWRGTQSNQAE